VEGICVFDSALTLLGKNVPFHCVGDALLDLCSQIFLRTRLRLRVVEDER
jgi:hypothetical protein